MKPTMQDVTTEGKEILLQCKACGKYMSITKLVRHKACGTKRK